MILLGACGFSYDEWGGGVYYPAGLPKSAMLDYYAQHFPAVELDVTYYRTPPRTSAEGMVRTAAGRLDFCVKAPGALTHERNSTESVITPFRNFLEPFQNAEKLGAVLFQFPVSFRPGVEEWKLVEQIAKEFVDCRRVIEFRQAAWDDPKIDERVRALGYSRAIVDQPGLRGMSASARIASSAKQDIAYIRFHGRNAAEWYGGDALARYTYNYSNEELREWAPRITEIARDATTTYVFFNNHAQGGAPANAQTLADILQLPIKRPDIPQRDLFG
ncbi:DUF72 domain-containing protein [soil metagenome]